MYGQDLSSEEKRRMLHERLAAWDLSMEQEMQLLSYYERLIAANQYMNLTAITEYSEVLDKHFADSFSIEPVLRHLQGSLPAEQPLRVMDVGTGAGVPGIPLKILCPHWNMTLADALRKRIAFLNDVISALSLTDVSTVHGRAEDLGRNPVYRDQYDLCVARAVSNLSVLVELCLPFVRPGGYFIAYKGPHVEDELKAAKSAVFLLGGKVDAVQEYGIDCSDKDYRRTLIAIRKTQSTPHKYPRRSGVPERNPL